MAANPNTLGVFNGAVESIELTDKLPPRLRCTSAWRVAANVVLNQAMYSQAFAVLSTDC